MACLEVRDTGTGIPPELISKIFDPFFTTKMPGKGTGLGLSTIYGIVKENNGRISVKETSPEGTTFILELPVKESEFDSIG
jgi:two-component system, NtrC family, sensor kinase